MSLRKKKKRAAPDDITTWLRRKLVRLFKNGEELREFLAAGDFANPNIALPTAGGKLFWKTTARVFGWKIQQHKVRKNHYRFLDPHNVRRAWTEEPEELYRALLAWEKEKKAKAAPTRVNPESPQ